MTAQIIWLNKWLDCPDEVKRYHDYLQDRIIEAKLIFEMDTRLYTPYQKELSRLKSQHLCRDRIRLVKTTQDEE